MIKINLLPPNIFEARAIKRVIILFSVVLIAVIVISLAVTKKVNDAATAYKQEADAAAILKQQADQLASQASALRSEIAPIKSKVDFFEAVKSYNLQYPALYEELAKFTYKKIIYSSLQPDGSSLNITAHTPSLKDAGRYLLNMYRASHIFTSVTISGVPGYPHTGSTASATGGGPMPAAPSGMGGSPGGVLQPVRLRGPGGPSLSGGSIADFTGAMGGGESTGGMPGGPGTTYGGIGAITSGIGRSEQKKQTGFELTVTCRLAKPIMAPVAPGVATGQTTPGMGGMPGGSPAGLPSPMSPGAPRP